MPKEGPAQSTWCVYPINDVFSTCVRLLDVTELCEMGKNHPQPVPTVYPIPTFVLLMELCILYFPSSNFKKRKQSIWIEGFLVDHRNELLQ